MKKHAAAGHKSRSRRSAAANRAARDAADKLLLRSDQTCHSTRPAPTAFSVLVSGWERSPDRNLAFEAPRELRKPSIGLLPKIEYTGALRGRLTLAASRLRTLRIRFDESIGGTRRGAAHQIVFRLAEPEFMFHDLPYAALIQGAGGQFELEFDLALKKNRTLERIKIELVEEDNWRVHPAFISAESYVLPAVAPAGARLEVKDVALKQVGAVRRGRKYVNAHCSGTTHSGPMPSRPRDAVLFSSWVPDEGLKLGEYFLTVLRKWQGDAKFFVGVNHGSSPRWAELVAASGLDVTIAPVPPTLDMPCDPAGFVAALDAFRADPEPFGLVWFGHTKGMSHRDDPRYDTGRWMIERMFWSRRDEIARHFENPAIGLYAPHYLMMDQKHLRQIDTLRRMYDAPFQPLGVLALSTHFVMRAESVRDFCNRVEPRFFREGPAPFGGSIYFFEMGMPNVPLAQGFEPALEPGLGATTLLSPEDGVSIQNDWRQNHAVVAAELAKWRRDPMRFRTTHREHRYVP